MIYIIFYVSAGSLNCDFETPSICGYLQSTGDVFNWTRATGATGSRGTGPSNDHTYGTSKGQSTFCTSVIFKEFIVEIFIKLFV